MLLIILLIDLVIGSVVSLYDGVPALDSWQDDCSKQAIETYLLPQCIKGVEYLTSFQQKQIALELSICEFENSKINYPLDCQSSIRQLNLDACVLSLEKSPQFWTTYSGYYKEVKNVCHEISLPFEKDQIVELYRNITLVYDQFLQDLENSSETYSNSQSIISEKFERLIDLLDRVVVNNVQNMNAVNDTWNQFNDNFESVLSNALTIINDSYEGTNTNFVNLHNHLRYFHGEFEQMQSVLFNLLNDQHEEIVERNQIILQQTNQINKNLTTSNELILQLNREMEEINLGMNDISSKLNSFSIEVHDQSRLIKDQVPEILNELNEQLVTYLNASSFQIVQNIEYHLNETMHVFNHKVSEIESKLDIITLKFERLVQFFNFMKQCFVDFTSKSIKMIKQVGRNGYLFLKLATVFLLIIVYQISKRLIYSKLLVNILPVVIGVSCGLFILKLVCNLI